MKDNDAYVQAELPRVSPLHKGRPYRSVPPRAAPLAPSHCLSRHRHNIIRFCNFRLVAVGVSRFVVAVGVSRFVVEGQARSPCPLEPCRYGYSVSAVGPCTFENALAKFDVETGETTVWHEPGALPTGAA